MVKPSAAIWLDPCDPCGHIGLVVRDLSPSEDVHRVVGGGRLGTGANLVVHQLTIEVTS
ncbi:MAG: hypothetical protein VXW92_05195 [Actinomycetota bacterium]|nr:hypothetical protein [Actinomycetota bacterium]